MRNQSELLVTMANGMRIKSPGFLHGPVGGISQTRILTLACRGKIKKKSYIYIIIEEERKILLIFIEVIGYCR